jgi:Fic family protein
MLLGEARSKCENIAATPLLPEVRELLHRVYLAKGARATTAIEGNTLSEEEVRKHIEGTLDLPPSKDYLRQEVANIVAACNLIPDRIADRDTAALTAQDIQYYNHLVLRELDVRPEVVPGALRTYAVQVGPYTAPPAEDCEFLLQRLCEWIHPSNDWLPGGDSVTAAVLKAIVAHLYIAWIHPFGDGNGRTARLVEFHTLVGAGGPSPAAHLLSNHYNDTRTQYYRRLDEARAPDGGVLRFIEYALQGFVDGLREQLGWIGAQLAWLTWSDHVHSAFRDKRRETDRRRRELALALFGSPEPVRVREIRRLRPSIAEAYAGKTDRAISRDLAVLESMGLVKRHGRTYTVDFAQVRAAIPARLEVD